MLQEQPWCCGFHPQLGPFCRVVPDRAPGTSESPNDPEHHLHPALRPGAGLHCVEQETCSPTNLDDSSRSLHCGQGCGRLGLIQSKAAWGGGVREMSRTFLNPQPCLTMSECNCEHQAGDLTCVCVVRVCTRVCLSVYRVYVCVHVSVCTSECLTLRGSYTVPSYVHMSFAHLSHMRLPTQTQETDHARLVSTFPP